MHFKWDSSVARDIVAEMDRIDQELGDCVIEVERCAAILQQMQGGELGRAIEQYLSLAGKLKSRLRGLGEEVQRTGRGIERVDEMFENLESRLRARADDMGVESPEAGAFVVAASRDGVAPLFYNIPSSPMTQPMGGYTGRAGFPWPALAGVNQVVTVEQVSLNSGVVMPQWLQGIIDF